MASLQLIEGATRFAHSIAFMTYQKRMVFQFCLFVFCVIQLALFQSKRKHYHGITMAVQDANNRFILALDIILLIAVLAVICLGWIARPSFELHALHLNSLIVCLLIMWIMVAGVYIHHYYANFVCNLLIAAFIVASDVFTLKHSQVDIVAVKQAVRRTKSKSSVLYNTLTSASDQSGSVECDLEAAAPSASELKATYPSINLAEKGMLTHGFRVNLAAVPIISSFDPLPTTLVFDMFEHVTHLVDSSSCHIYTALWNSCPVVLKLIKVRP